MKPEDLFTPPQLEPWWRWEFGVFVDLRDEGLGVHYASSHPIKVDAHLAASDAAARHPGAPVYVARRKVSYSPWDELEPMRVPSVRPHLAKDHDYTGHGHPCCGKAPAERPDWVRAVAGCGGPGMCEQCADDRDETHAGAAAVAAAKKQGALDHES